MKDKKAAKAKQKRRAAREADRKKERDRIMSHFDEVAKERGLVKYNKQDMWKRYWALDKELTEKSIVYSVVVASYCLHKNYGWGRIKLSRFAKAAHRYIKAIDEQSRTVAQLKEELEIEAAMDWTTFDNYKPYKGKKLTPEQDEGMVIAQKMAYVMPLVLYSLYFNEGWKAKRMNRISGEVLQLIKDVVEKNEILRIKETLRKECKLRYCDDGSIYLDD